MPIDQKNPEPAVKTTAVEARQGVELHRLRYILGISLAAAVLALVVAYLVA